MTSPYGADAVRFGLLAMSSTQDVRFSEEKIAQGQALANKLFNATRFVLLQVGEDDVEPAARARTVEDRWILSRLRRGARVDGRAHRRLRLRQGRAGALRLRLRRALRLVPGDGQAAPLREDDPEGRADLAATLRHVLRETLLLAHPMIPFVTEELWGLLGEDGLLAAALAPSAGASDRDDAAEEQVGRAIAAVTALRGWRDRCEVRPGAVVPVRLPPDYDPVRATIEHLARVSWDGEGDTTPVAAVAIPRGTADILPSPDVDVEAAERTSRGAARRAPGGDRARGAQARQRRLRRQGAAARGGRPSARSSSATARSSRSSRT